MSNDAETLPDSGRNGREDSPSPLADAPRSRDVLGPYRLLERIGVGGMGEVWLAEQSEPIARRVAIKFIHLATLAEILLERGEVEEAAGVAEEAMSIYRASLPDGHAKIASGEVALGAVRGAQGRFEEAEALLRPAFAELTAGDASVRSVDRAREQLASLYDRWERPEDAARVRASAEPSDG